MAVQANNVKRKLDASATNEATDVVPKKPRTQGVVEKDEEDSNNEVAEDGEPVQEALDASVDSKTVIPEETTAAEDPATKLPSEPITVQKLKLKQKHGHRHKQKSKLDSVGSHGPNLTTGQWSFFPGIDDDDEEEDNENGDSTTSDAMAYLRSVRYEASLIPGLLTAPLDERHESTATLEDEQNRGYYDDGAYIATSPPPPDDLQGDDGSSFVNATPSFIEPQIAYHKRVLDLFSRARQGLHTTPSADAVAKLPATHPITFPPIRSASIEWAKLIRQHDPLPAQVACMATDDVLRLVRLCATALPRRWRRRALSRRLSAWVWAALARLDDVGTLTSEDVAMVRELGKRAAQLSANMAAPDVEDAPHVDENAEGDEEDTVVEYVDDSDADAERDMPESTENEDAASTAPAAPDLGQAQQSPLVEPAAEGETDEVVDGLQVPDANTIATVSMILTVVGEAFGQRDLLAARTEWRRS